MLSPLLSPLPCRVLTPVRRCTARYDDMLAHEAVAAQFYRFEPFLRKALQARWPAQPARLCRAC